MCIDVTLLASEFSCDVENSENKKYKTLEGDSLYVPDNFTGSKYSCFRKHCWGPV